MTTRTSLRRRFSRWKPPSCCKSPRTGEKHHHDFLCLKNGKRTAAGEFSKKFLHTGAFNPRFIRLTRDVSWHVNCKPPEQIEISGLLQKMEGVIIRRYKSDANEFQTNYQ